MKYYQELAKFPTFTFKMASKIIGNNSQTTKHLNLMIKEGSIRRIKQNLYTCVNFAIEEDYANRFQIASNITDDSFISFHSAFEFYGFYNQTFYELQVCSFKRFVDFVYDDYSYKCFQTKIAKQIDYIQGVRVASIERTIVDTINMLGKVMDIEEFIKCLDLIHHINEDKILEILKEYNKEILYRKVGYLLSFYQEKLSISTYFLNECKSHGKPLNKGYFVSNDKNSLTFNSKWGLYAYSDLTKLVYKGGNEDV